MNGPWRTDGGYWEPVAEPSSDVGEVLQLLNVCWLDMGAEFVLPDGVWNVFARVRLNQNHGLHAIRLEANTKVLSGLFERPRYCDLTQLSFTNLMGCNG